MKTEKEVERWPDSRVRRWGDEWINRHADGWLDRRKGSIENRWTDSDSDGQNSILIAGDKYTKDRKITYDVEDRQRQVWKQEEGLNQPDNMLSCLTMYIPSMYICMYYAYIHVHVLFIHFFISSGHVFCSVSTDSWSRSQFKFSTSPPNTPDVYHLYWTHFPERGSFPHFSQWRLLVSS